MIVIIDRRHAQLVPKGRAVFGVVQDLHVNRLPFLERRADMLDRFLIGARPLQEAAIIANDLFALIARDIQEGLVHIGQLHIPIQHRYRVRKIAVLHRLHEDIVIKILCHSAHSSTRMDRNPMLFLKIIC